MVYRHTGLKRFAIPAAVLAAAVGQHRRGAAFSPKTLEANLTRNHRKLNIRSRAELGRIMGQFDS